MGLLSTISPHESHPLRCRVEQLHGAPGPLLRALVGVMNIEIRAQGGGIIALAGCGNARMISGCMKKATNRIRGKWLQGAAQECK